MKRLLCTVILATMSAPLWASVGVSINVGQPGFFGQIQLGDYPRPQVLYAQPIVVEQGGYVGEPIYLHVPPGQARRWKDNCHAYGACGRPVYFVQDNWYQNVYAPRYREQHGHDDERGRGDEHDHGRGHDHGDERGGDEHGGGDRHGGEHGGEHGHGHD